MVMKVLHLGLVGLALAVLVIAAPFGIGLTSVLGPSAPGIHTAPTAPPPRTYSSGSGYSSGGGFFGGK
jgi:hypothetical protein